MGKSSQWAREWKCLALLGLVLGLGIGQQATAQIFVEVGAVSGADDSGSGSGMAWGDYDSDGDLDLYVTNFGEANQLYRNDGGGLFSPVGPEAGVDDGGDGTGAVWGDYDNDGDLDLYVANFAGVNKLYRNDGGGVFAEVGLGAGIGGSGDGTAVVWGDYDNDGDLDLYIANFAGQNELYRNEGDGTFVEAGLGAGVNDGGDGTGAVWGDYDGDGDLDLYIANSLSANVLYRNDGSGVFAEIGLVAGVDDEGDGAGVAWGDYDQDGDLDLYLANVAEPNRLYRNDGGDLFSEVAQAAGVDDSGDGASVSWVDYDNDGNLDIYLVNSAAPNVLYRHNGADGFDEATAGAQLLEGTGLDFGGGWGDYDNDGDLDLYLVFGSSANRLYRNEGTANNWLAVELVGTTANRSAIGAQVTAVRGLWSQRRDVEGGSGFWSQPSLAVEFGLGGNTEVDSLVVLWPGGGRQAVHNVAANQSITLVEAQPATPPFLEVAASVDFATAPLGTSANQTLNLTNSGGSELVVSQITASDGVFAVVPSSFTLAAGASRDIQLSFTPSAEVLSNGTLTITSNAANGPSIEVAVSGTGVPAGTLSARPNNLDFSAVEAGTARTRQLWVRNSRSEAVTINRLELNGDPSFSLVGPQAPFSIAAGDSVAVEVRFAPNSAELGSLVSLLDIFSSAESLTVSIGGRSFLIGFSISPDTLDFGPVPPLTRKTLEVLVANDGDTALDVTGSRSDSPVFTFEPRRFSVAPGQNQVLEITFAPFAEGSQSGKITLVGNAAEPGLITVTGFGGEPEEGPDPEPEILPVLVAVPASVDFGQVDVGKSGTDTLVVFNDGDDTLRVAELGGIVPPFALEQSAVPALAPNARWQVPIHFTPIIEGTFSQFLQIESNGGSVIARLSGSGVAVGTPTNQLRLLAEPSALDFGEVPLGGDRQLALTVTNPSALGGIRLRAGLDNGNFSVEPEVVSIGAEDQVEFQVRYTPGEDGPEFARLMLEGFVSAPLEVALIGSGKSGVPVAAAVDPLDLGEVGVGGSAVASFLLENRGTAPLLIDGFSGLAPPFVLGADLPEELAAGQGAEIAVSFSPVASGFFADTLDIATDAGVVQVLVDARAIRAPVLAASADRLDFGQVGVGAVAPIGFELSSIGTETLQLNGFSGLAPPFALGADPPGELAPGQGVEVVILFSPTAPGSFADTLDIATDGGRVLVALSAVALPVVPPLQAELSFGQVFVGERGLATLLIENTASDTLVAATITSDSPAFSITNDVVVVPPAAIGALVVHFDPAVAGVQQGRLALQSNLGLTEAVMSGEGVLRIELVPEVDFGRVELGRASSLALSLINRGGTAFNLERLSIEPATAGLILLNAQVPSLIDSDAEIAIAEVEFIPQTLEPLSGVSLRVEGGDFSMDVAVSGRGFLPPRLVVSRDQLDFGRAPAGGAVTRFLNLLNSGGDSLHISGITSDTPAFVPQAQVLVLGPGQSEVLEVKLQTAEGPQVRGTLSIASDDPEGSHEVELVAEVTGYASFSTFGAAFGQPTDLVSQPFDLDHSGQIDFADFFFVLSAAFDHPAAGREEYDLDGDGRVEVADLLGFYRQTYGEPVPESDQEGNVSEPSGGAPDLLKAFGQPPVGEYAGFDFDSSGQIDIADFFLLLVDSHGQPAVGVLAPFDLNNNGIIDDVDFALFDQALSEEGASGVTEPSSAVQTGDLDQVFTDLFAYTQDLGNLAPGQGQALDLDGDQRLSFVDFFELFDATFAQVPVEENTPYDLDGDQRLGFGDFYLFYSENFIGVVPEDFSPRAAN